MLRSIALAFLGALFASAAPASTVDLTVTHKITPDVVYQKADNVELKLDLYTPKTATKDRPVPTLLFFHGGGWMEGSKAYVTLDVMPYLDRGWAAVTVQYRLGGIAPAPAAVEDARCAVWWVLRHADDYGFDPDRIVLSGGSAGGHIALITGMAPASAGFDRRCPQTVGGGGLDRANASQPPLNVAAIINWAGITDVADLLTGPHTRAYALMWMGGALADPKPLAERVSPIRYVRKDLPPILTLHGDRDEVVPYEQAVRLHQKLDAAGAPNELHTLPGREHFRNFTVDTARDAFATIDAFLEKYLPR